MRIHPTGQQVLIKPVKTVEESMVGKIIVPALKAAPPMGEVIEISKGLQAQLKDTYSIKKGSYVMYKLQTGVVEVYVDGETLLLVNYNNILARVDRIPGLQVEAKA